MDLVFEGGGIKGLAYVGALRYLEERGISIGNIAGTSVGAIFGSLCAVGYSSKELQEIIEHINPDTLWPKSKNFIQTAYGTIKKKALYSMDSLELFLDNLYKNKGKDKFRNLKIGNNYKLKVISSNVNARKLVVIPDDLKKYKLNPDEFSIAKAVCMSSAIPVVYKPYKFNGSLFVDGGIFSNFPIWLFKDSKDVLGFRLGKKRKTNSHDQKNIIYIDTSRYKATDFRKGFSERHYLYNIGYYYTKLYFDNLYR